LAAHAGGQIEFGTYERDTLRLGAAYKALTLAFDPDLAEARDAFASNGYIDPEAPSLEEIELPPLGDYRTVLAPFPIPRPARRIFATLENCRIDRQLRFKYRGLIRDLDLIRGHLRRGRPRITELPASLVPFELLFQITLLEGALEDSRQFYSQVVSEL